MQPLPINIGTLPADDLQVNRSQLLGGFVNSEHEIQLLPHLTKAHDFSNAKAILSSTFKSRIIVATQSEVFYIQEGSVNKVGDLISTVLPVRMAENAQNQVTIVNGSGAWVFDQNTTGFSQLNSASNGFDLANPVDVTVLNTITIVVGGTDKEWIVSDANDAVQYAGNEVKETDENMKNLTGVRALDNNLFIFGQGGVQRWVPATERLPSSFPFSEDPTYRDEYGCVATGSLVGKNNEIYYLSESGQVRMMTAQGALTLTNDGIENIITGYSDKDMAFGSYFYHKGYYLYQLTFETAENAFVFCPLSKKWSESDDLIRAYSDSPLLADGVYDFDTNYTTEYKKISMTTPYIKPNPTDMTKRVKLGLVMLEMTQGKNESADVQLCFLQISKDNVLFGNRVKKSFSPVGKRLFQFRWYVSLAHNAFTFRFELQTKQDITITNGWFDIK